MKTTRRKLEERIRHAARFAEEGSHLEDGKTGDDIFAGADWLWRNAKLVSHSPELVAALEHLLRDYNEQYQVLTDGQYGNDPGTVAYRTARRLVRKLSKP